MSDLVKEINALIADIENERSAEGCANVALSGINLLRRIQDALTWKPVDYGKMPHRKPFLFKMRDGSYRSWDIRVDEVLDKYYYEDVIEPEYSHYIEIPPFGEGGPEEK